MRIFLAADTSSSARPRTYRHGAADVDEFTRRHYAESSAYSMMLRPLLRHTGRQQPLRLCAPYTWSRAGPTLLRRAPNGHPLDARRSPYHRAAQEKAGAVPPPPC